MLLKTSSNFQSMSPLEIRIFHLNFNIAYSVHVNRLIFYSYLWKKKSRWLVHMFLWWGSYFIFNTGKKQMKGNLIFNIKERKKEKTFSEALESTQLFNTSVARQTMKCSIFTELAPRWWRMAAQLLQTGTDRTSPTLAFQ